MAKLNFNEICAVAPVADIQIIWHLPSMQRTAVILSVFPLISMSCGDPVIDPSTSLVGAKDLPSATILSAERIYIGWGGDGYSLTYDWKPNNVIIITLIFLDLRTAKTSIISQERVRVPEENAKQARKLFWRMRPTNLDGPFDFLDREHRPLGCQRTSPHDWGEVRVTFHSEGDKAKTDDDRLGVFR